MCSSVIYPFLLLFNHGKSTHTIYHFLKCTVQGHLVYLHYCAFITIAYLQNLTHLPKLTHSVPF